MGSFWNPHATQRIKVIQYALSSVEAAVEGAGFRLRRTTSSGAGGATITPGIANHSERAIAPPSGAQLRPGVFIADPTREGDALGFVFAAVAGAGFSYSMPGAIVLGPSRGLVAEWFGLGFPIPLSEITVVWLEHW